MFCQKCGNEISESTKFCAKCGNKINAVTPQNNTNGNIEQSEDSPVTTTEVATIPQLKDQLIAMKDAKSSDAALTYAVEAQLQVLDVLNSPAMTSSCFDLMIESLSRALQMTSEEQQKKELQNRASIMVQNIIFFMEAKLRYEENKHSEQGKVLLKKGCSLLAESASGIMSGGLKAGVKIMGGKLFDDLVKEDSFFSMLFDFIDKEERIEKNNREFDTFIADFFGKLDRYKNVFGKSILLTELVHRYKDRLIKKQKINEPQAPCGIIYRGNVWFKSFLLIGVLVAITFIPVKFELIAKETWIYFPFGAFILWIAFNIIYLITCIAGSGQEKKAYKNAMIAYDKYNEIINGYYLSIADSYDINNSSQDISKINLNEIRPLKATIEKYQRLHDQLEQKKDGKSWITCVFLCILLGWMGAHRFYAGKTGTGILMLILLPSGVSVIWAIIDLIMIFSGKFKDSNENEIRLLK